MSAPDPRDFPLIPLAFTCAYNWRDGSDKFFGTVIALSTGMHDCNDMARRLGYAVGQQRPTFFNAFLPDNPDNLPTSHPTTRMRPTLIRFNVNGRRGKLDEAFDKLKLADDAINVALRDGLADTYQVDAAGIGLRQFMKFLVGHYTQASLYVASAGANILDMRRSMNSALIDKIQNRGYTTTHPRGQGVGDECIESFFFVRDTFEQGTFEGAHTARDMVWTWQQMHGTNVVPDSIPDPDLEPYRGHIRVSLDGDMYTPDGRPLEYNADGQPCLRTRLPSGREWIQRATQRMAAPAPPPPAPKKPRRSISLDD